MAKKRSLRRLLLLYRAKIIGIVCVTLASLAIGGASENSPVDAPATHRPTFIAFESGPVRPMTLTPSGQHLIVTNIPDNRIEVFEVNPRGNLIHQASIPVGLEPVAVAARSDDEVWVVNHLSDSISIVSLSDRQVLRTLLAGDEPRDIVFAGANRRRAFITTAHRGQHRMHPSIAGVQGAGDPQFTTPGIGRADVWVFDAENLGETLGGTPLKIMELFGDTPRALAVNPDGATVYAAIFNAGNQTTVVPGPVVCQGFETADPCFGDGFRSPNGLPFGLLPGGNPGPSTNYQGVPAPEVGLVVKFNRETERWEDELGRNWGNGVRFFLPDLDVFAINAARLEAIASYAHVGTTLFNLVVNPVTNKVYVSNTDAQNHVRFEGNGEFGGSTVQGNLAQARITVIDPVRSTVQPRHLNKHIDYRWRPASPGVKDHSLATPLDMVVSSDGSMIYVAAFGSGKVGVLPAIAIENNTFDPVAASANYIVVSGGGPAGLVLNEPKNRLYVYTRFDNGVSVIDPMARVELTHIPMHNPEPAEVVEGRPFLYEALNTSSNGEASCASCHIFGDTDHLAWDLGNPDAEVVLNPLPIGREHRNPLVPNINGSGNLRDFHPMKGPMTTQTLKGMRNNGAMHWRGDRANGFFGIDPMDAHLSFRNFVVAFPGLVGGAMSPTDPALQADVAKFADFALSLTLPPNPVRNLDNSLTAAQANGREFFDGPRRADGRAIDLVPGRPDGATCEDCHQLDPSQGFFGTDGSAAVEEFTQIFKVPHLRTLYQKVGMFGLPDLNSVIDGDNEHTGDQIRGFGYGHAGDVDTLFRFLRLEVFNNLETLGTGFDGGDPQRRDVEQYMLAFDTDLAPIVGQQITLDRSNADVTGQRINLLIERAKSPFTSKILGGLVTECDLVVHLFRQGRQQGYLYDAAFDRFKPDTTGVSPIGDTELQAFVLDNDLKATYLCVPPGSGHRIALDRDEDGELNGDESNVGTDPDNSGSVAGACSDGVDNDGDGAVDLEDNGCTDAAANIENPQCLDGYDNDGDGDIDAADPACSGQPWATFLTSPTEFEIYPDFVVPPVDSGDIQALVAHWHAEVGSPNWDDSIQFDLDNTGKVDIVDIALLVRFWKH